jgi:TPP-dependent pyruvate/acetoin dehydrogenase alpha subunit
VLSRFGRAPSAFGQIEGRPRTLPLVGLVGTWVPMSVGVAMADRLRRKDAVTVTFFGDGAANEGAVHEAMNLAGARRLPMVFVLENNGMAISMSNAESSGAKDLFARAAGYGMPGVAVDGQDPLVVHESACSAILRARKGEGPTLIEARVTRWEAHAVGFTDLRDTDELARARRHDGVLLLRERLLSSGAATEQDLAAIETQCRDEVDSAVREALRLGIDNPEPAAYSALDAERMTYAP